MKNPFRTRYGVTTLYTPADSLDNCHFWTIMYRKWWQSKWRYIIQREGGLTFPIMFNSKEEALNYISITQIN